MKYKKNTAIKLIMTIGGIGLLSSLFIGLNNSFTNPLAVSAQVKPSSINVVNLNDTQVNSYYDGVDGLSGDALLSTLNGIIDDHREYNYNSDTDRYSYKIIDRNWDIDPLNSSQLSNFDYVNDNGFIRKFYADYNDSVSTADRYKNVGATRVSFDKEHVWAQSLGNFGRDDGAGSDFHSLVPADIKGNSPMHSNYNFATPTSSITNYNNDYETYVGRNGYISGSSQKVCEPLDEYKGDIARAMFYMPARYYTWVDITHPKLTLVNGSPAAVTASESQPGLAGDLATLLQWNELDPVDEYEIHRNNLIYNNFQLNRNPFIDHPEWARIAYDTSYSGSG
ncbi:MAG: endonuclease, partial [Bacilli bacterium]